jgi:hypothetical protein
VLDIAPRQILGRGRGPRALRWAQLTTAELAASEALRSGQPRLPALTITDWPSLSVRAVSLPLPTSRWGYPNDPPVDPVFFRDFLDRMVVGLKFNFLVLLLDQGMQLSSHPEVPGPAAWPQATVAELVAHLRAQGVEVVPGLNSLGHAEWLTVSHPELREDGDLYTLCTSHPSSRQVLGEIYEEVLRVFQPRYFHLGMDEVRWKTLEVPAEKRCRLCAGKAKASLFAEQVRWLHDFCAARGVKTMMWGDMLLPTHNGGAPFNVAEALPQIPRDIIICDWSAGVDPLSLWWFASHGFRTVLKSNSLGCSPADLPWATGNMFGCWAKLPWLVEGPSGPTAYNFLHFLQAANYSWNLYPDLFTATPTLAPAFFADHKLALVRLALASCRSAAEIYGWAAKLAKTPRSAAYLVAPQGQTLGAEQLGSRRGKWLVLVAALQCTPAQLAALREGLKQPASWLGAPVAAVQFRYRQGPAAETFLGFGYHLRAADSEGLPYVYGGVALTDPAGWYAVPLANPRPTAELTSVLIQPAQHGSLYLAGAKLFPE